MSNETDIENLVSLFCSQIPKAHLNVDSLRKHFSKYGDVTDINIYPSLSGCIIYYDNHESASIAKKAGSVIDNHKILILWNLPTPLKSILKSSKTNENTVQTKSPPRLKVKDEEKKKRYKSEKKIENNLKTKSQMETHEKMEITESSKKIKKDDLELLKVSAKTSTQYYNILDNRDNLLRMKKGRQNNLALAKRNIGTCPDMCPEKERYRRESQHQISIYEQGNKSGIINHSAVIKQYTRSSADQTEPLPHELRPTPVLRMTMDYMLDNIIGRCEQPGENLGEWYHFIWDRTRAIRKDITQQELCDENVVILIEQCARFHIFCSERLIEENSTIYDDKINTENLTKCLQTLRYMYSDLNKNGKQCRNEAEFRAYMIYLNMNTGNCLSELQNMREEIRKSPEVSFAINVFLSLNTNNYVKFFSLVKSSPYLVICIVRRYFLQMRYQAISIMVKAYTLINKNVQLPLNYVNSLLGFTEMDHALRFYEHLNLCVRDDSVMLSKSYSPPNTAFHQSRARDFIKTKVSIKKIIAGGPVNSSIYKQHIPHSSFNRDGKLKKSSLDAKDQSSLSKIHIFTSDVETKHDTIFDTSQKSKENEVLVTNNAVTKSISANDENKISNCLTNTRFKKINVPTSHPSSSKTLNKSTKDTSAFVHPMNTSKTKPLSKYTKINKTNSTSLISTPNTTVTSPNLSITSQKNIIPPTIPTSQITNFSTAVNQDNLISTSSENKSSLISEFKFALPSSKKQEPIIIQEPNINNLKRAKPEGPNVFFGLNKKIKNVDPIDTNSNMNQENKINYTNEISHKPQKSNEKKLFFSSTMKVEKDKDSKSLSNAIETDKEIKRKKILEELDLLSQREMEIILDIAIKELLIEASSNVIEEEKKLILELERLKKIEELSKRLKLEKMRLFFYKWREYSFNMKEKFKRESFPAWICTNNEITVEYPNSLNMRKSYFQVKQIKNNDSLQVIIDLQKIMYETIKKKILNSTELLPENIFWDILVDIPNDKDYNLIKTWLRHMFSSSHHQTTNYKEDKFIFNSINIHILVKTNENIPMNNNELKVYHKSFIFYFNTSIESTDLAVQRLNQLLYSIPGEENIVLAIILSGEQIALKNFLKKMNIINCNRNFKFSYKILYLSKTNYIELYDKFSESLNYLASSFSIKPSFQFLSISEFFEKFFLNVLNELTCFDVFIEISKNNINYLVHIYNNLMELFIYHIKSSTIYYLCIDFFYFKNNYSFIKNPNNLIDSSKIKLLEKHCKEGLLDYFPQWPPKDFQQFKQYIKDYCCQDIVTFQNIIRYVYQNVEEEKLEAIDWENLTSISLIEILSILIISKITTILKNNSESIIVYKEDTISNILKEFKKDLLAKLYNEGVYNIKQLKYQEEEQDISTIVNSNVLNETDDNISLDELRNLYKRSFT